MKHVHKPDCRRFEMTILMIQPTSMSMGILIRARQEQEIDTKLSAYPLCDS